MANRGAERVLYSNPDEHGQVRYWYANTIWRAAKGAPTIRMALKSIELLDDVVWFGGPTNRQPTIRNVAEHAHHIVNADMSHPIIVVRGGEIIDGAHRIARAYIEGRESIEAVVIDEYPEPDGVLAEGEVAPPAPEGW